MEAMYTKDFVMSTKTFVLCGDESVAGSLRGCRWQQPVEDLAVRIQERQTRFAVRLDFHDDAFPPLFVHQRESRRAIVAVPDPDPIAVGRADRVVPDPEAGESIVAVADAGQLNKIAVDAIFVERQTHASVDHLTVGIAMA